MTYERYLTEKHGDLHKVVPALVNQHGQLGAALRLGVTQNWVSRWLKENGYIRVAQYVKEGETKND